MDLRRISRSYREIEDLPFGSVILTGGLAFQCAGEQDQKKVWDAAGIGTSYTTGLLLDISRREGYRIDILYVPESEETE